MSFTFKVDDVQPVKDDEDYHFKQISWRDKLQLTYTKKPRPGGPEGAVVVVDGASDANVLMYGQASTMIAAVGTAYNEHRPLSLSPDHIWLSIAHAFAQHVKMYAEELRKQFVAHEGKKYIEVNADDFAKGSPHNDWTRLFGDFSTQIEKHIGRKRDLLVCDFTTTGVVEKACSEIVLMDAMSKYFDYGMRTACGFPEITLEGTVEDWESVLVRVGNLREYGNIGWWIDPLEMVCAKLVETAQGKPDLTFWRSFYMEGGGSGGPYISGWINVLYPYLKGGSKQPLRRNTFVEEDQFRPMLALLAKLSPERRARGGGGMMSGPNPGDYPSQMSAVPVKWHYLGQEFEMRFLGGLGGVTVGEQQCVRPAALWGILDVTNLNDAQKAQFGL